jgi:hypothetical protein
MSDTSGWWARKLGNARLPQRAPQYVPQQPQLPPQGDLYAQPQGYPAPQQPFDPSRIRVTTENLFQVAGLWKGGPAHRTDTEPCPECGSPQYFSRRARMSRMPPPAPHCYNCGYNGGLFDQGSAEAWGYTGNGAPLTGEQR